MRVVERRTWRTAFTALALLALAGAPLAAALALGAGAAELGRAAAAGALAAVDAVGFVVVPQSLFGVAIAGLLVERLAARAAALAAPPAPGWLDPAIESCLLLGMLGTISGMVQAFASSDAASLDPAFLVHYLGTALRSSYVGFSIALLGVWLKARGEVVPA